MKIIQLFKKGIKENKQKRLDYIKKWLYAYYCQFYEVRDYGRIAIPYFLLAERKIKELESHEVLEMTYKQIKEGVRVA